MHKCSKCGKELPDKELFSYVDENNEAITKHSKDYCWRCYNETHTNKIGLDNVLRSKGHSVVVEYGYFRKGIFVDDKFYSISPTLKDELIKEYNL